MKKVKNIFSGVIAGIVFIIVGTLILWFGEKNNVNNIKTVQEIEDNVISVNSESIDSNNEGKLICTNGDLIVSDEIVSDSTFNVGIKTSKLVRVVEMYEWDEDSETDSNDNTVYTYKKVWSDKIIDSSSFNKSGYDNPTSMPYEEEEFLASSVKVGEFSLSDKQKSNLGVYSTLQIPDTTILPTGYKISNYYITNSVDEANPQIGDIRISYQYNNWNSATILAVQTGDSFSDFVSKVGKNINRVENGKLTTAEVINKMKKENNFMKWLLRIVGIILNVLGFVAVMSLITNILNKFPLFGNIVSSAINLILGIVGFIYSLIIIVIAWFRYRPLLCLILLLVIAALIALILYIKKKNKATNDNNEQIESNPQINNINQMQNNLNYGQPQSQQMYHQPSIQPQNPQMNVQPNVQSQNSQMNAQPEMPSNPFEAMQPQNPQMYQQTNMQSQNNINNNK